MEVILLERIEKLGQMGDVVKVKPGYARNYLLPQRKALRATKDNLTVFEAQRAQLEAQNLERKQVVELLGDALGLLLAFQVLRLELRPLCLEDGQVALGRPQGFALRQQVIARIARLDLDHVAHLTELLDALQQNNFHRISSSGRAVTA